MGPKRGKKQKDSLLSRLNGFLSQDGPGMRYRGRIVRCSVTVRLRWGYDMQSSRISYSKDLLTHNLISINPTESTCL